MHIKNNLFRLSILRSHYLAERKMSNTSKQQEAAAEKPKAVDTQPGAFTRKLTTSKSGRFREKQNRRGSLFDEQGKSLFGDAAPAQQKSAHHHQDVAKNASDPQAPPGAIKRFFTMAF